MFPVVSDLQQDRQRLQRWPCGIVDVVDGQLQAVSLRPWSRAVSIVGAWLQHWGRHRWQSGDRCRLSYCQPWGSHYLALRFVVSYRGTSLATFHRAMQVLDEIARIKDSNAILCQVSNRRISDRLMRRAGWQRHMTHWLGRHYIKRFYGTFPETALVSISGR